MEEKVDKGFCLIYKKLSNRRKFIRQIWYFLFSILYILIMKWGDTSFNIPKDLLFVALPVVLIIEAIRFFQKCKKELI